MRIKLTDNYFSNKKSKLTNTVEATFLEVGYVYGELVEKILEDGGHLTIEFKGKDNLIIRESLVIEGIEP